MKHILKCECDQRVGQCVYCAIRERDKAGEGIGSLIEDFSLAKVCGAFSHNPDKWMECYPDKVP